MLKNTLIKAASVATEPVRPKLTVIRPPAPDADVVPLTAILDKLAEVGIKDILVTDGKSVNVHKANTYKIK